MKTSNWAGICTAILLIPLATTALAQSNSSEASAQDTQPTSIACAQERGEPLGQCDYRVDRDENGKVTVTAIFANGFKRNLFFEDGTFRKASMTMSGVGKNFDWNLENDVHVITVDGQRYEVPDGLIAQE